MNKDVDFRKTLNLPKTEFSMRAGLAQKEPKYLEKWEDLKLWEKIKDHNHGKEPFILHDGPPYANGNIHIGHALNKILKDFIVKSKSMQNYDAYYVPGWDCHGLPIEHQLLKEKKQGKNDVDPIAFRKEAHDYAMKYVHLQKDQFKRLGVFGEWENPYLTLDPHYEYYILKSLAELSKKGYIYRGLKPVNWCVFNETALAEAEVEYEDIVSTAIFVRFKVENSQLLKNVPADKEVSLLVWTTTPWTLVANVAVAVHESFEYCLVDLGKEIIVVEESLLAKIAEKAGWNDYHVLGKVKGKDLTQLTYTHIFNLRNNCPVVTADYVTKEDGTGLVHTAPGHGMDDFQTGKKYKLDVVMVVNERGIYEDGAGPYVGQHVFKANKQIVEDLKEQGFLLLAEDYPHSYPHSWRSKKPIIFRATHQWFMNIDHDGLRAKLIDIIKNQVDWVPASGEERILSMVNSRPDWCLSRQRHWGVPIPALRPKGGDGEPRLYVEVIDHLAELVKKEGTDIWFSKDVQELLPEGFTCPDTGATEFEKTYDILDVWFDSGVSHQAVFKGMMARPLPAELYLEGSDQHRGWFQSSLIPGTALEGRAPYKQVLTHGFVVDAHGRKMSKSLGNVISPLDIMKNSGADILRLWVSASSYNEDIRISKEVIDRLIDAYRKIRNTLRYLLGNLFDFNPNQEILDYAELLPLDQWALDQLFTLNHEVTEAYNHYEFSNVYKKIYSFCNEELSNFYLDILKDRLYISAAHSKERKSAQTALYHILNRVIRLVAPILSFTCEEVFEIMPKADELMEKTSIHLLTWDPLEPQWQNDQICERFELLIELRPYVMKALEEKRSEGIIGSSLEAKVIFKTASTRDLEYLNSFKEELADYFVVSQAIVEEIEQSPQGLSDLFNQTTIEIVKADGKKCERSWKYSTDVGQDPDFPTLSLKSAQIVKEYTNASEKI